MAALPPPRDHTTGVYRVALVCLGNICRSAMAHVVMERKLEKAGLSSRVEVDSSGTGDWHIGEQMDRRAAATLTGAGYDATRHRSRLFESDWYDSHDLILVMDDMNRADVLQLAPTPDEAARVMMFREFDPQAGEDLVLPDPWYGGLRGFEDVLDTVERTTDALIDALAAQ